LWRYGHLKFFQDGGHRHLGKISNGHISTTGRLIHSMFGSRVGFSGTADLMALFAVRTNPRWRPPPSWKNFKWPYLRNRLSDLLHVLFYGGFFGDGGYNGATFANHMYGQFTCLRRQQHIASLLMRKTLELDFVWEVSYSFKAGNKIAALNLDNLRIANNALFTCSVLL